MKTISNITVIGAGTMGSGIALTAALSGKRCTIVDVQDSQLTRTKEYHQNQISKLLLKEKISAETAEESRGVLAYSSCLNVILLKILKRGPGIETKRGFLSK